MSPDECVRLIALARAAYPGMSVVEGMPVIWLGTLGDLRYAECAEAVVEYAKDSAAIVTVADIRRRVIQARVRSAGEERTAELESRYPRPAGDLVPMPDWFRTSVEEHRRRAREARKHAKEAGEPVTFGEALVHMFDRQPKGARTQEPESSW